MLAILQTYATEFETAERRAYRAVGEEPADGTVVVATDADAARERICSLVDADSAAFDVDPL